ncbi:flavodoxin FldA [Thermosynechococcus sp. QKsg1]|uniref:flavodoxin FldA n=1 Tax=unclassified Thermosynechococcus TaxID=2622553 RepID=UPI00122E6B44|nr:MULTISPECIES: flavodoxin FldA [unclassified Thermosynechococcus]QEQ00433.1 flavodoxin FldA [Thermosynechococcus sp. CL-1]WJI24657.1 flavodoxin FldA [Thermosynechococcus sp. B0]WJI27175.1 flavodoxin FldA [Thermosynechococcus sp. B1]WJI29705.1 flavodoxin FldA [Thermosynechococcus sp. B3]WKT84290.1 flavodoxin FldA [Thermosynechococcus sp. HY596]
MATIGLFYGTQTGNTQMIAEKIQSAFANAAVVELHDIASASPSDFEAYDRLIIGCPTWNVGELQADWEGFYEELDSIDFTGKKVAYFGAGDQVGYADNFGDAIGILEAKISERGGETVGYWSMAGYEFNASQALRGDRFVGLLIDEDNQSDLTDQRVQQWVAQLKQEFGL